jgi:hypothetical protein
MPEVAQIKAVIPRELKCRTFAALALRDDKFNRWLCRQLEAWLQEVEEQESASEISLSTACTRICQPE